MEFQTLNLHNAEFGSSDTSEKEMSFWKRQFQLETTERQRIFDWSLESFCQSDAFYLTRLYSRGSGWRC